MASFSRLQLAAALLEYDNDPDDPSTHRSAKDSAIFSHIRTRDAPRARTLSGFEHLRETPNHLGVELPYGDVGSARGSFDARRSLAGTRNSRGSIDALRNPFGDDIPDSEHGAEGEGTEEDLEVDLEAWGMAEYLGNKDKHNSKNRRTDPRVRQLSKAQSEILPNPHLPIAEQFGRLGSTRRRQGGARSQSMGGFGSSDQLLEAMRKGPIASEADFRRRSLAAPLDPAGRKTPNFDNSRFEVGTYQSPLHRTAFRDYPSDLSDPSPHPIPFPSSSPEPAEDPATLNSFALPLTSPTSRFDPKAMGHGRTMSHGSLGSHMLLDSVRERTMSGGTGVLDDNFASRFDKATIDSRPMSRTSVGRLSTLDSRERTTSFATMGTSRPPDDDNPFSLPPPSPTRTSRFDPKAAAHARATSTTSLGSHWPADGDRMSIASGQPIDHDHRQSRRYTRLELMRPKILIMPPPLQENEDDYIPPSQLPDGFQLSTVGPPLPPGAKSAGRPVSRLMSAVPGLRPPVSDTFTPNPRVSLSLSQLTFRNSLMVGGQRDVAYEDIESNLRRAREDGEQILQEEDIEEEIKEEQKQAQGKAAGKLYGRSLMDELEARKEKMRSKQRVFTGDQRPSMMSRGQIRRSSTLIDPATLQDPPASKNPNDRPMLSRRNSSGSKPLLDFSDEAAPGTGAGNSRVANSRSVFGVDQLWERELVRLKEIEALERVEEEERKRKEEENAAKKAKRKKGKIATPIPSSSSSEVVPHPPMVADLPPTLPDIPKATTRRPRPPTPQESDSDTDSAASEHEAIINAARRGSEVGGWDSSDEEGLRRPKQKLGSESDDDVPLARQLQLPSVRAPSPDSEDEKPLAKVLERKTMLPDFSFDNLLDDPRTRAGREAREEEDDTPLAIRHPRAQTFISQSVSHDEDGEDDDDEPLGLKQVQKQQQQAQFNFMAQQQMMMQAHMNNSMAFGAPSMLGGFTPFMMPPPVFSGPPALPAHDPAKYHSVDQWRHNVSAD